MSNNPLDGITFHGIPIEDKLKFEPDEECLRSFQEEVLEKKNLIPPIYCKTKYKKLKERNGMTRKLTQTEMNSQYLGKNLMRCRTQKEFVICLLLSSDQPITNKGLYQEFKGNYSISLHRVVKLPKSVTTIATLMQRLETMMISQFMKFEKKQVLINDKKTWVKTYTMTKEGLELRPEKAFKLAKQRIAMTKGIINACTTNTKKIEIEAIKGIESEEKAWEDCKNITHATNLYGNEIPPLDDNLKYNIPKNAERDITWEPKVDEEEKHDFEDKTYRGIYTAEPVPISLILEASKEIKNIEIHIGKTESGNSIITVNFN